VPAASLPSGPRLAIAQSVAAANPSSPAALAQGTVTVTVSEGGLCVRIGETGVVWPPGWYAVALGGGRYAIVDPKAGVVAESGGEIALGGGIVGEKATYCGDGPPAFTAWSVVPLLKG